MLEKVLEQLCNSQQRIVTISIRSVTVDGSIGQNSGVVVARCTTNPTEEPVEGSQLVGRPTGVVLYCNCNVFVLTKHYNNIFQKII